MLLWVQIEKFKKEMEMAEMVELAHERWFSVQVQLVLLNKLSIGNYFKNWCAKFGVGINDPHMLYTVFPVSSKTIVFHGYFLETILNFKKM